MLKIALVDDNTDFLLLLRKKVHTFFDGRNVLCEVRLFPNPEVFYFDLEEGFHYDICFLDIEMPQMNGLDLAKRSGLPRRQPIWFSQPHIFNMP